MRLRAPPEAHAAEESREAHVVLVFHVAPITQPQHLNGQRVRSGLDERCHVELRARAAVFGIANHPPVHPHVNRRAEAVEDELDGENLPSCRQFESAPVVHRPIRLARHGPGLVSRRTRHERRIDHPPVAEGTELRRAHTLDLGGVGHVDRPPVRVIERRFEEAFRSLVGMRREQRAPGTIERKPMRRIRPSSGRPRLLGRIEGRHRRMARFAVAFEDERILPVAVVLDLLQTIRRERMHRIDGARRTLPVLLVARVDEIRPRSASRPLRGKSHNRSGPHIDGKAPPRALHQRAAGPEDTPIFRRERKGQLSRINLHVSRQALRLAADHVQTPRADDGIVVRHRRDIPPIRRQRRTRRHKGRVQAHRQDVCRDDRRLGVVRQRRGKGRQFVLRPPGDACTGQCKRQTSRRFRRALHLHSGR